MDSGVASFEDVDRAWMTMYHTPMGPFGKMDEIGLDVVKDIEEHYASESNDPADLPPTHPHRPRRPWRPRHEDRARLLYLSQPRLCSTGFPEAESGRVARANACEC